MYESGKLNLTPRPTPQAPPQPSLPISQKVDTPPQPPKQKVNAPPQPPTVQPPVHPVPVVANQKNKEEENRVKITPELLDKLLENELSGIQSNTPSSIEIDTVTEEPVLKQNKRVTVVKTFKKKLNDTTLRKQDPPPAKK
jgi:hypothetical protein